MHLLEYLLQHKPTYKRHFLFIFLCKNSSSRKSIPTSFFLCVTSHDCTSWKLLLLLVGYSTSFSDGLSESFHPYGEIPSRKGKYPEVLGTNTNSHQVIRHAKNSYSIVLLVFCKFSCGTYQNGLNRDPQSWGTPSTSKTTNCVSLIPFVGSLYFSTLLHRVQYLKNLFMSRR